MSNFIINPYQFEQGQAPTPNLLIQSNSNDGALGFLDSGSNGYVVTVESSVTHSTEQAKFGNTSLKFDGTTGDLSITGVNGDWAFGTGDFTVDMWLYPTGRGIQGGLFRSPMSNRINNSQGQWTTFYDDNFNLRWHVNTTTIVQEQIPLNTWVHIAWVRYNGVLYMMEDGVLQARVAHTQDYNDNEILYIGRQGDSNSGHWIGYIDEIRVIKGFADGWDEVVAQGDWGSQVLGTTLFTPPTAPYGALETSTLLIHSDTTNGNTVFTDDTQHNWSITTFGDAEHSTDQAKFGATSIKFDGTGDYLQIANSSFLNILNNEFSFDTWLYTGAANSGFQWLFSKWVGTNDREYVFMLDGDGAGTTFRPVFRYSTTGADQFDLSPITYDITQNTWHHFYIGRVKNDLIMCIDGVLRYTTAFTNTVFASTTELGIGSRAPSSFGEYNGYLDEIRFRNGEAGKYDEVVAQSNWASQTVGTTLFTPPTTPYTQ